MEATTALKIYTKGISFPNPGHSAWGWHFTQNNRKTTDSGYIGPDKTNNEAAYVAIGKALREIADKKRAGEILVYSDSQIAVKQINGECECHAEQLIPLRDRCRELLRSLPLVKVEWIPGEKNHQADILSRMAYFEAVGKFPPQFKKK